MDNFDFTPGTGAIGAADNIGGVLYPRVKLDWGADGTANDVDIAAGKALPVQIRDTSGNELATASHPLRTDPTGTTTQPISATSLPLPTGAAADTSVQALVTTTDFDSKVGSLTETAPASDTASSGLNGRLQRIAQRLTSLIALLPSALGAGGGIKVDGSGTALPISAASLPLPTGAALETGGNLATIAADIGAKTDAANTATDTTSVSGISIWKQISKSVQAIATSVSGTLTVASHAVTNAGTFAVQSTEVDGGNVTLGSKADAKSTATDTTAITIMSVLKQVSASVQAIATSIAGTLTVATHAVTQSGTWTVQPGNTPNTTAWLTTNVPTATGGPTVQRIKAAASTNATSVKASAGQVYGWALYNNTAAAKFVKIYNKASSPTVGTDTPAFTIIVPASGGTNVEWSNGIPLGTGIALAITGVVSDGDTTAVAVDDVTGVLLYK